VQQSVEVRRQGPAFDQVIEVGASGKPTTSSNSRFSRTMTAVRGVIALRIGGGEWRDHEKQAENEDRG
jgi:hypothetical protein